MNIPQRPGPDDMARLLGLGPAGRRRRNPLWAAGGLLIALLLIGIYRLRNPARA